jgi:RNA polymerase sigma-70 factor (ECF subfamily)
MKNNFEDEDIKLMLGFKNGDISCFGTLFDKYKTKLLNFVYRFVGNQIDAEDITQEVFLRVYNSKNKYKPKSKFSTWIYKIAKDLCIDYLRKHKHEIIPIDEEIIQQLSDKTNDEPNVSAERNEINKIIHSALFSLPVNQRTALYLKVYENKSYKEIAQILGCSVSAVESLIFRARQSLKEKLSFLINY